MGPWPRRSLLLSPPAAALKPPLRVPERLKERRVRVERRGRGMRGRCCARLGRSGSATATPSRSAWCAAISCLLCTFITSLMPDGCVVRVISGRRRRIWWVRNSSE